MSADLEKNLSNPQHYQCELPASLKTHVPLEYAREIDMLWSRPYGAYIYQNDTDAHICGALAADGVTVPEVFAAVMHTRDELEKADAYSPMTMKDMELRVMAVAHSRLGHLNSKIVVASILKYYLMVLDIRADAYTYWESKRCKGGEVFIPDENYLAPDSPIHSCFIDNFPSRVRTALQHVGTELHFPILDVDRPRVNVNDDVNGRLSALFESPRYNAYKTYVFDRSNKEPQNSVTWLKARARHLVKFAIAGGYPVGDEASIVRSIDVYTDSMRTSTTGSVLASTHAVFAPKSIEGDRLLMNLFKHHLWQILPHASQPSLTAIIDALPHFCERQEARRTGGAGLRTQKRSLGSDGK